MAEPELEKEPEREERRSVLPLVIEIMPGQASEGLVDVHEAGQELCLREFVTGKEFSAGNVVSALEQGLAALYSGYNPRLRNGYHSLDPLTQIRRSLDFTDYRIPRIIRTSSQERWK